MQDTLQMSTNKRAARLLLIDDEPGIVFSLTECLSSEELIVESVSTGRQGIEYVENNPPDAVLLDVRLPDISGLDVFAKIHEIDPRLPVIIMTAFAKTETAIEAMRRGAFDYLVKPVDTRLLRTTVGKAVEMSRLTRVPALIEADDTDSNADVIIGNSPVMQEVYKQIGRIAPQNVTVLILGESGTGKELVARAIYHYSQRAKSPFLAMNCAALPETLLESELFGHEKGAFTGADSKHIGKFEQVNGGTIFLDEIGDMSLSIQSKALRLLQQQQFERLGGNQTITTDVRIITATNRNLADLVAKGKFREDLYYRLNGYIIHLPPLRDRKEDIPQLTQHFIKYFNNELNKNVIAITPEALEVLKQHNWPGNIREFRSAIQYAIVQATSDVLTIDTLPNSCMNRHPQHTNHAVPELKTDTQDLKKIIQQLISENNTDIYQKFTDITDKMLLSELLHHTKGQQALASRMLGMSRNTLRGKLRSLGIIDSKHDVDDE